MTSSQFVCARRRRGARIFPMPERERAGPHRTGPLESSHGVGDHVAERDPEPSCKETADDRAHDRHPGVAPVARSLALDGKEGVRDSGPEVTGWVDRIPRRATEGGTDSDDQEGD